VPDEPRFVPLAFEPVRIAVGGSPAREPAQAGRATSTHTPARWAFCGTSSVDRRTSAPYRPGPVGYPAPGCTVPDLVRKPLDEIIVVR
jgi:hypothetical protein